MSSLATGFPTCVGFATLEKINESKRPDDTESWLQYEIKTDDSEHSRSAEGHLVTHLDRGGLRELQNIVPKCPEYQSLRILEATVLIIAA